MEKIELKYIPVYSQSIEKKIQKDFKRLEGQTYLDHAGAALYSEKQIEDVYNDLRNSLFANPHSKSLSSKQTEDEIDQIRFEILKHFNTNVEDYTVIFTSGATSALKLVGEAFNYNGGQFVYLEDNHTSVLGMREYAKDIKSVPQNKIYKLIHKPTGKINSDKNSLFVYPAQCNFSGYKYPLDWIENIQNGCLNLNSNWFCLLDAASFVSNNNLDLGKYKPDFVCVSFYKMFGYPTGLGALLVRNQSGFVLEKKYFGGGTVFMALSSENTVIPRNILNEKFEDGTLPFLSILSLFHGFSTIRRLNIDMELISRHVFSLGKYLYNNLLTLHHKNGKPACILYHDGNFNSPLDQGGIVNFNLLRPDCSYIGYAEVMHMANLYRINLRTGCFCNPGACQRHLKLDSDTVKYHFQQGHVCGDQNDLIDGKPTGSVRISFGYMSTKNDIDCLLKMIEDCFVTGPIVRKYPTGVEFTPKSLTGGITKNNLIHDNIIKKERYGVLEKVFIYPLKSCGEYSITTSWQLASTGLKYDREWMIINQSGVCLTQKQEPKLCTIKPIIDLKTDCLILTCSGFRNISIPLEFESSDKKCMDICQSKVCAHQIKGWDCGNSVANWLNDVLCRDGLRLLKQFQSKDDKPELSLANKAQYLMVNKATVNWLLECVPEGQLNDTLDDLVLRFRPNFVVNFDDIFVENECENFQLGQAQFKNEGKCTRCQMICIDQNTGEKSVEPLRTLSKEIGGRITFGLYLKQIGNCDFIDIPCQTIGK